MGRYADQHEALPVRSENTRSARGNRPVRARPAYFAAGAKIWNSSTVGTSLALRMFSLT